MPVMPLSPESRRGDKEKVKARRVPRFYLAPEQVEEVRRRYPRIEVREFRGRPYVVLWDFPSCSFIRGEPEKATRELLAYSLVKFLKWRGALPDDLIEEYRRDREKAARDLARFVAEHRGLYSESYLRKLVYGVRMWLYANGVEVPGEVLRKKYRVRFRPPQAADAPPTRGELRRILLAAPPNWRAFFSFLSATGVRPSEALVLRMGDLSPHPYDAAEADEVIAVTVPATIAKKDFSYTTFAHPECARLLAEHLKILESRGYGVEDPDFPLFFNPRSRSGFYRVNTAEVSWNKLLRKLGLDDRVVYPGRAYYVRRLYTLRKFFRTNLEAAGVPYGAVEAMLGHKNWYVRFTKEQLRKYYEKGMWALVVLSAPPLERVEELVEEKLRPIREEVTRLKRQKEEELLAKEREARALLDKLYEILRRHPEILKELEEELGA